MRLFKKNQKIQASATAAKEEKAPRTSYLDVARKLGRHQPKIDKNALMRKLFPRTAEDLQAVSVKTGVAMDAKYKPLSYDGCDIPDELLPYFSQTFIGWQACALLAQHPIINKACSVPARDAVAVDYKLQYVNTDTDGDPDTDQEQEQEILNNLKLISDKKMTMKQIIRDANIFKKTFGQILLVPTFSVDMKKAMEKPYAPSAVKKGTYTGMSIVQPFWVTYQLSGPGVAQPDQRGFYDPEYYIIGGSTKIHKSWVTKLVNGAIADILKPVYYYGGFPLTQQIYERVYCATKTADEAPRLALTKRLLVIDGNLNNLMANPEQAYETLKAALDIRDSMGLMVKNPGDSVQQLDTSLNDMDALIMTQYQLVAAIAEMPVTKLMKTQLKGLANTGTYEMKDYNQSLVEIQENDYNLILEKHYEYLTLSEYGRKIDVEVVWNPIDTPTELELADIEAKQAATDNQYIMAGVLDPSEVRKTLREAEDSRYGSIDPDLPEPDIDLGEEDDELSGVQA